MKEFSEDIYTEPQADADTLNNLGPLKGMAGIWSYEMDTVMLIRGQEAPFHHVGRNTLSKVAEPSPNPKARG